MNERLGMAVIGLNGAVATTAAAGIAMVREGSNELSGLPLAHRDIAGMAAYRDLQFGGWDLSHDDLGTAAMRHGVIGEKELSNGASSLNDLRPWPAVGSTDFCASIDGANKIAAAGHRAAVERIQADLQALKRDRGLDRVVIINLASTERKADLAADCLTSVAGFERGLDANDAFYFLPEQDHVAATLRGMKAADGALAISYLHNAGYRLGSRGPARHMAEWE